MQRFLQMICGMGFLLSHAWAAEPGPSWTYRGNSERTGCIDGQPGPAIPKVLWALTAQEHFAAAPVVVDGKLYLAGLGGFNVPTLHCLPADAPGTGAPKPLWSKTSPDIKQGCVSSPAVVGDRLVIGDGMHQSTGAAFLYCLAVQDGRTLWRLPIEGDLVHLEGSPTLIGTRVFMGAGAAGVVCVDRDTLLLNGKETTAAEIEKVVAAEWKRLQDEYEAEKKKNPDFAVPPSRDRLPVAAPKVLWQQGQKKWHVDAPVAVVGDRVLVTSTYLDKEKEGDRALYCLDAASGAVKWRQPLQLNPWSGATVSGQLIIVGGSTCGYYPQQIKGAKGDLSAFDLSSGERKWRKEVPGGIVGSVAISGTTAYATATDGKLRAFDLDRGERRWIYDAKAPLFAAPAVAGDTVYIGDLKGVVHAVHAKDGSKRWTLDLGADPAVKAAGMIYGGPVLAHGRLYLATCNLEGPFVKQPTAIVCIGSK